MMADLLDARVLIFGLGFLTLNLGFGLGGEYSPIVLMIFFLIFSGPPKNRRIALFLGFVAATGVASGMIAGQKVGATDVVRVSVGVFFLSFGPGVLIAGNRQAIVSACEALLVLHIFWLLFFALDEPAARAIYEAVGLRGGEYVGQNSYFSSEPSYAALNAGFLYSIRGLASSETTTKQRYFTLLFIVIELATKSVTGLALAGAALISGFRIGIASAAVALLLLFSAAAAGSLQSVGRVQQLLEVLSQLDYADSLRAITAVEPSGAWRLLANMAAVALIPEFPFGTGGLTAAPFLTLLPDVLQEGIVVNPTYAFLRDIGPQAIFPAFSLFAGLPGAVLILVLALRSIRGLGWAVSEIDRANRPACMFACVYIFVGAFWQSALTAPGWWVICGIGCAMIKVSKNAR